MLPAGGRVGDPPAWPLARAEAETWKGLWATPQAAAWEKLGWTRVVARYAVLIEAVEESEGVPASALLGEVRQMEDRLGLNPKAMRSLLWEVSSEDAVSDKRDEKESAPSRTASKRVELKIVG
jgi:hypothetical protein